MRLSSHQRGSSHLVALLAVVVIAAVAFAGYRVVHHQSTPVASSAPTQTASVEKPVPAKISNRADVQQASNALDSTDVNSVNPNQLDSDLNSL